jgi:hypothetical protein
MLITTLSFQAGHLRLLQAPDSLLSAAVRWSSLSKIPAFCVFWDRTLPLTLDAAGCLCSFQWCCPIWPSSSHGVQFVLVAPGATGSTEGNDAGSSELKQRTDEGSILEPATGSTGYWVNRLLFATAGFLNCFLVAGAGFYRAEKSNNNSTISWVPHNFLNFAVRWPKRNGL